MHIVHSQKYNTRRLSNHFETIGLGGTFMIFNYQADISSMDYKNDPSMEHTQIPNLPLLGTQSFQNTLRNIHKAIVDEATAAELTSRLLKESPDELHREFLAHAYHDELQHLETFSKLTVYFTGTPPQYTLHPVRYSNYKEGIKLSLKNELESGRFYRDVILSTTDTLVKDTFFHAMVDELEHATQFGVLYNTLG
jgi:rubrerythrin